MCIVAEKPQVRIREYKKLNFVLTRAKVCSFYCLHIHVRERIYRLENKCAVLGAQFKNIDCPVRSLEGREKEGKVIYLIFLAKCHFYVPE